MASTPRAKPRGKAKSAVPDTLTDPVDWAAHYWEQQELEGDAGHFLAMTSLFRLERIIVDTVETELKQQGLNLTDYLLLMTLQLSESGTRLISSLARNLMVHPTTATLAVDRLEERKLLFRSAHPTDRRATCVTISASGRKNVDAATRALSAVDFGMQGSTPTNVSRLMSAVTSMRQALGDTGRR